MKGRDLYLLTFKTDPIINGRMCGSKRPYLVMAAPAYEEGITQFTVVFTIPRLPLKM